MFVLKLGSSFYVLFMFINKCGILEVVGDRFEISYNLLDLLKWYRDVKGVMSSESDGE